LSLEPISVRFLLSCFTRCDIGSAGMDLITRAAEEGLRRRSDSRDSRNRKSQKSWAKSQKFFWKSWLKVVKVVADKVAKSCQEAVKSRDFYKYTESKGISSVNFDTFTSFCVGFMHSHV